MTLVAVLITAALLLHRSPQRSTTAQLPPTAAAPPPLQTLAQRNEPPPQDRLERLERSLCERAKVSIRPLNGARLVRGYRGGKGEFTVTNGTTHDAAVVLVRRPGRTVAGVFVRSGNTADLEYLSDGVYEIQYALGEGWLPSRGMFCDPISFGRFESLVTFTTSERATNDGVEMEATTYRITLHPVPGGTARTRPIPPESFAPGLATGTNP